VVCCKGLSTQLQEGDKQCRIVYVLLILFAIAQISVRNGMHKGVILKISLFASWRLPAGVRLSQQKSRSEPLQGACEHRSV
jgi:hypothetical protein